MIPERATLLLEVPQPGPTASALLNPPMARRLPADLFDIEAIP